MMFQTSTDTHDGLRNITSCQLNGLLSSQRDRPLVDVRGGLRQNNSELVVSAVYETKPPFRVGTKPPSVKQTVRRRGSLPHPPRKRFDFSRLDPPYRPLQSLDHIPCPFCSSQGLRKRFYLLP